MSVLWLLTVIFLILGFGAYMEDERVTHRRYISWMAKRDLKARRRRGDIFKQEERGGYRW